MSNLNSLITQSNYLQNEINYWKKVIEQAPEGNLVSRILPSGHFRYNVKTKLNKGYSKEIYLPASDIKTAEDLAMKQYALHRLQDLENEKKLLDQYIQFCCGEKTASKYLKKHPGIGNLVIPKLRDKNSFIQEWANADYQRSNLYPEKLIYPTVIPNLKVRSKAEADWISRLVHFGIPLRYEELIISNQVALHPDITGLNITTLTPVYIEHQGGWDKDDYIRKLEGRSLLLKQAGIIPWKNLIITTETRSQPLDINWIDELIQYFFM